MDYKKKLGIEKWNEMQKKAFIQVENEKDTIIISPTGTGKTLAFLIPVLELLKEDIDEVQALILVPSRELAIQIEQVARNLGSGFKINAVYGGRSIQKDIIELQRPPELLIGTPGRIADHFRRGTFRIDTIKTIILDEFDKSLEVGFEVDMKEILVDLVNISKRVLTSATQDILIPKFVGLHSDKKLIFDKKEENTRKMFKVLYKDSQSRERKLLDILSTEFQTHNSGIIFCNFKNTIEEVAKLLKKNKVPFESFYGGMEQKERERTLIKYRNGSASILLATDLAARGIDVSEVGFIVHFEVPMKEAEFIHRNGRTARMHSEGKVYILQNLNKDEKKFVLNIKVINVTSEQVNYPSKWKTIFISGGRKDKISKGDVVGLFLKKGGLKKEDIGIIELKNDCCFVAVTSRIADNLVKSLNNSRIKKRKVRMYTI